MRFPTSAKVAVKEKITFVTVRVLSSDFIGDDVNVPFIFEYLNSFSGLNQESVKLFRPCFFSSFKSDLWFVLKVVTIQCRLILKPDLIPVELSYWDSVCVAKPLIYSLYFQPKHTPIFYVHWILSLKMFEIIIYTLSNHANCLKTKISNFSWAKMLAQASHFSLEPLIKCS